jgi:hypothetical protein
MNRYHKQGDSDSQASDTVKAVTRRQSQHCKCVQYNSHTVCSVCVQPYFKCVQYDVYSYAAHSGYLNYQYSYHFSLMTLNFQDI